MTRQLAFHFEQKYCTGCRTCQIACKDKNDLEVGQNFRKVYEIEGGDFYQQGPAVEPKIFAFYISVSCNHCIDPACVKSCPEGAIRKRAEDGIVVIDSKSCVGCRRCMKVCPYDAIVFDPAGRKVSKCDFCLDELEEGRQPICVAACPMRALDFGQLDDLQHKYGTCDQTFGMPEASKTRPALVITPHPGAIGRHGSK